MPGTSAVNFTSVGLVVSKMFTFCVGYFVLIVGPVPVNNAPFGAEGLCECAPRNTRMSGS